MEVIYMERSSNIFARVEPEVKEQSKEVFLYIQT